MSRIRVASVAYFNSKPLIEGLDEDPLIDLSLAVPAKLIDGLATGQTDVALLPTIDYQTLPGLRVIPVGGIGCDGATLTVRLFARVPMQQVKRVACDMESHTSIALAKILFAERYGRVPAFVPMPQSTGADDEALLLIGDKVICESPVGYPHQLDLGEAWKDLTGLPFVFAIWTARAGVELADLPARLAAARRLGLSRAQQLVDRYAVPRGWPADVALRYVLEYLHYDIGPRQLEAIERFHRFADEHGLLPGPRKPLITVAGDLRPAERS